jgi:DNA-binding PadR family transcriptional regulator
VQIEKIIKAYIPMTETAFYILLSLHYPRHGYGIIKFVESLTQGRIKLGSGTVYGTLTKMLKDGIIMEYANEERKTVYLITSLGTHLIKAEFSRIKSLYENMITQEGYFNEGI